MVIYLEGGAMFAEPNQWFLSVSHCSKLDMAASPAEMVASGVRPTPTSDPSTLDSCASGCLGWLV